MKIHPALLVKHLSEFIEQSQTAATFTNEVDVDVIDWLRSPGKTVTAHDVISTTTNLILNFDLMMDHPMDSLTVLVDDHRINRIIINVESKDNLKDAINFIYNNGKKAGISLNPESNISDYKDLFSILDLVQIMTIEPGRQGNKFMPDRLALANQLKGMGFHGYIETDGGTNFDTIIKIKDYPIDIISVGSALSKAENPARVYRQLNSILQE